jgi:hypothetical protein
LAQYKFTIREEEKWSFLAEQRTIFGKDVLINDSDVRLMMKQQWLPTPPYCGRMNAFMHVIPGVAKIPSMGALPLR